MKKDDADKIFRKKASALEEVMNKYNPIISAREYRLGFITENEESEPFPYKEENHSYDNIGL